MPQVMSRNIKETSRVNPRLLIGVLGVTAVAAAFGYSRLGQGEQPQLPERPPIAGPAIAGADVEQEQNEIPQSIREIIENLGLKRWRASIPEDYAVSIGSYEPVSQRGTTSSPIGLKVREWPSEAGAEWDKSYFLEYDRNARWTNIIIIRNEQGEVRDVWANLLFIDKWEGDTKQFATGFAFAKMGPGLLTGFDINSEVVGAQYREFDWPKPQ